MTLLLLTPNVFVVCVSMMPEPPPQRSHGYSNPLDQWAVVVFWVARESPTTVDP
jgi:hypothetical protein